MQEQDPAGTAACKEELTVQGAGFLAGTAAPGGPSLEQHLSGEKGKGEGFS